MQITRDKLTIESAIQRADEAPQSSALVARPPLTWGSEAMFVTLTDDYSVPANVIAAGYQYVLGLEDINKLLSYLKEKRISTKTAAEFVVHYAMMDAYPAWIEDIPNR